MIMDTWWKFYLNFIFVAVCIETHLLNGSKTWPSLFAQTALIPACRRDGVSGAERHPRVGLRSVNYPQRPARWCPSDSGRQPWAASFKLSCAVSFVELTKKQIREKCQMQLFEEWRLQVRFEKETGHYSFTNLLARSISCASNGTEPKRVKNRVSEDAV